MKIRKSKVLIESSPLGILETKVFDILIGKARATIDSVLREEGLELSKEGIKALRKKKVNFGINVFKITNKELSSHIMKSKKLRSSKLKEVFNSLYQKEIKCNILNREEYKSITSLTRLLSDVRYVHDLNDDFYENEDDFTIFYEIPINFITTYLYPSKYVEFDSGESLKLGRSKYNLPLYQFALGLKGYKKIISLEELRGLIAYPEGYSTKKISSRILKPFEELMNENNDFNINFAYKYLDRDKKPVSGKAKAEFVMFDISRKTTKSIIENSGREKLKAEKQAEAYSDNTIKLAGMFKKPTPAMMKAIEGSLATRGYEYTKDTIVYAFEKSNQNPEGYFLKALENGWADEYCEQKAEERSAAKQKAEKDEKEQAEKILAEKEKEAKKEEDSKIFDRFNEFEADKQEEIVEQAKELYREKIGVNKLSSLDLKNFEYSKKAMIIEVLRAS